MKGAIFIGVMWVFWLSACAHVDQKSERRNNFTRIWRPIISFLNQDPGSFNTSSRDLPTVYREELAAIEEQWNKEPQCKLDMMKNSLEKHEFFFQQITKLNEDEIRNLERNNQTQRSVSALLHQVLSAVESHPVASSKRAEHYDRDLQIGFCFGRALLVHYYLLKAGVPQKDILKVFALGDFNIAGQFWHFHVAVMVNDKGKWMVIDPLYGEPASYQDWVANVKSLEIKHPFSRARFYVSDPRRFMPASGNYSTESLLAGGLSRYFHDLGATLVTSN
ncbi:MAG TPA: hypothetical protein VEL47_01455 [Myxococcota bacterium]|nr:hypothetical protein [Myxococcota bacterium]